MALPSDAVRAMAIFDTIFSFIALIPLITAFMVFFTTPSLFKSHQNYLFISLLSTGLIFLGFNIILIGYAAIHNEAGLLNGIGCLVGGYVSHMCAGIELYSLASLAIERYFMIVKGRPLSKKQILIMVAIGWTMSIMGSWSTIFTPTNTNLLLVLYNNVSRDPNSLALVTMIIINGAIPVNVIVHCYLGIYQHFKTLKKKSNNMSTIMSTNSSTIQTASASQTTDTIEFQILVTVFVLVGWTLVGNAFMIHELAWSPIIFLLVYEAITGTPAFSMDAELVFSTIIYICIGGDSIILMVFDRRWNAAARDFLSKLKKGLFTLQM